MVISSAAINGRRLADIPLNVKTEGGEARLSLYELVMLLIAIAILYYTYRQDKRN